MVCSRAGMSSGFLDTDAVARTNVDTAHAPRRVPGPLFRRVRPLQIRQPIVAALVRVAVVVVLVQRELDVAAAIDANFQRLLESFAAVLDARAHWENGARA